MNRLPKLFFVNPSMGIDPGNFAAAQIRLHNPPPRLIGVQISVVLAVIGLLVPGKFKNPLAEHMLIISADQMLHQMLQKIFPFLNRLQIILHVHRI